MIHVQLHCTRKNVIEILYILHITDALKNARHGSTKIIQIFYENKKEN